MRKKESNKEWRRECVCLPIMQKGQSRRKSACALEKEQDRKSSPCPEKTLMAVIFFCVSHISGRDSMCVSFSRDSWRF